jgi:hypothetical protein
MIHRLLVIMALLTTAIPAVADEPLMMEIQVPARSRRSAFDASVAAQAWGRPAIRSPSCSTPRVR